MKARLEKGEVKQYNEIPKAFLTVAEYLPTIEGHNLDEDGNTLPYIEGQIVKDADTLSDDTLKLFGFFDVVIPECDWRIQELTEIYFDTDVFKKDVVSKELPFTIDEYKEQVITNYNVILFGELFKTDYHYIKKLELGTEIPQDVLDARTELRAEAEVVKAEIMALNTKEDVLTYDLPNYNL